MNTRPGVEVFRTFCHINEYEEDGFANLHRMIAVSEPVILWSPSSQLLQGPSCRISPDEFIEYVTMGRVRIIGRSNWLKDKDKRDESIWPGARWDNHVDGAIKSIAEEDENLPDDDEKRVLIAPDEQEEKTMPKRYLEENPKDAQRLIAELEDADARKQLPRGMLGSTQGKSSPSARFLTTRLLRDVFNHGEAIHLASAEAPLSFLPRARAPS